MRCLFIFVFVVILSSQSFAQEKPKLVVGIIVDQMRQEYLYRFEDKYSEEGFKKLMNEGYVFKNAHFNYVPTYTAPGHASVYTGSTPAIHGIIGNNWYEKSTQSKIYCTDDSTVNTVGSSTKNGKMSPQKLLTTTIGDELRFSNQKQSKVIGISIKDRGAIFPAGHTGEAYWHDRDNGKFITSTYYHQELPKWVETFNKQKRGDYYLSKKWEPINDIATYIESDNDENAYESGLGKDKPTFPYTLEKGNYRMLPATPFGNDLVAEMSLAAIENTTIGTDEFTDMLAISFSSTDYIGHAFGPNSKEVEDAYIRLDRNIAQIIKALDKKVGKGNYTIFLTADHAVAEVPQYLIDNKVPAGYFDRSQFSNLNDLIANRFGEGNWLENVSNNQIFIDRNTVTKNEVSLTAVQNFIASSLLEGHGVANSYPAYVIQNMDYNAGGIKGLMTRGYNQKRSGDVLINLEPGWIVHGNTGSTHGSPYTYDTHVPMLWYGNGIKHGESVAYKTITQIAPTLSMMLNIKLPNGATGQPLNELFD